MYMSPIVRTYYSMEQYRSDAGQMAAHGFQAVNVEPINETNGCLLTFLLITGLLLTPRLYWYSVSPSHTCSIFQTV